MHKAARAEVPAPQQDRPAAHGCSVVAPCDTAHADGSPSDNMIGSEDLNHECRTMSAKRDKKTVAKPVPIPSTPKAAAAPKPGEMPAVELRGHTFEDHRGFVPRLVETMAANGCWLIDQRTLSPSSTQLHFELQLRSVFELYGNLIASGITLTRDSHTRMKSLCTVRDHNPHLARRRRILTIRLELSYVEESDNILNLARTATGLA
jgi:hypothetical protein